MPSRAARNRLPRLSAELRQRESVRPLELFFDLVFVFGFTQCTALMAADLSFETLYVYDERRYRLRHDMQIDIPGSR